MDSLKAECGQDQIATVGNWVTLSGERSTPAGRIGYRWIQLSGPLPKNINEDGDRLMFLPTEEGTYEFALVVAEGNRISVPDFVLVVVGALARATRLSRRRRRSSRWIDWRCSAPRDSMIHPPPIDLPGHSRSLRIAWNSMTRMGTSSRG